MIVLAITLVSFVIFSQFDLLEMIVEISSKHEAYEIDELVSSCIIFSICMVAFSFRRWREERQLNQMLVAKNEELQQAFRKIKVLEGVLPICSYCKKIKDDEGDWLQIEQYIDHHSEAEFSHGVCPTCTAIPKQELKEILNNPKKHAFYMKQ